MRMARWATKEWTRHRRSTPKRYCLPWPTGGRYDTCSTLPPDNSLACLAHQLSTEGGLRWIYLGHIFWLSSGAFSSFRCSSGNEEWQINIVNNRQQMPIKCFSHVDHQMQSHFFMKILQPPSMIMCTLGSLFESSFQQWNWYDVTFC